MARAAAIVLLLSATVAAAAELDRSQYASGLSLTEWQEPARLEERWGGRRVVLEETLERFAPGELELAPGYTWECVGAVHEYGPETLEVVWRR